MNIPSIISCFEPDKNNEPVSVSGWVRTVRSSSSQLLFCVLNDGSDVNGLQVVISNDYLSVSKIHTFEKEVKIGCYIKCTGKLVKSIGGKQKCEMQLLDYEMVGSVDNFYPLAKSKMNLDTLRQYLHFRPRTNVFGSVFRIRSKLMKQYMIFIMNWIFIILIQILLQ